MRVEIAWSESGTKVHAKGSNRHARILGVITRCQPDGYALTLFETVLEKEVACGYCHVPAFG